MKKTIYFSLSVALLFTACKNTDYSPSAISAANDVVAANVDTTVSPADDFFQFVNGGWLKRNPIPASESNWGIGKVLQEDIYLKMRKVSEDAVAANAAKGSNEQKIGDFWTTGMDSATIEKQGLAPIKPELDRIAAIKNVSDLLDVTAELQMEHTDVLFSGGVSQDEKQSDRNALHLWQGGLGLGERDYYFNKDARNAGIRKEYVAHLNKMFQLLGSNAAAASQKAAAVFKIETFLAEKHRRIEDLRDPQKNYNKMSVADVQKLTPSVSWAKFMQNTAMKTDTVIVGQPEFYQQVEASLKKFPIADWQAYLQFSFVSTAAPFLPKAISDEHFAFYGTTLEGKKEQKPRWKRVLDAQEHALGDALGQLFVKQFFSEKAKTRYENMVEAIRTAFAENLNELDWMSAPTKAKALDKLQKVVKKVGYPSKWKDFAAMQIGRESYVRNALNASKWWSNYEANKLGKPVDRTEFGMTPQTYNAYYNPSNNEIVLPAAAFMIPNFKDEQIDDAVAYGYAAASTIGHEITHGFDDEGRQFDAAGNLVAWWSPEDSAKFTVRAKVLANQFSEYVAVDTMHVRGDATLGENIADLGGVVLGLKAFKKTEQFKKNEKIAGYTPLQRYFMGYSIGWMSQQRKERLARQIMTDVHAPANLRVNGPFVDVPEFYDAFGIKQGDKMWREPSKRAKIW